MLFSNSRKVRHNVCSTNDNYWNYGSHNIAYSIATHAFPYMQFLAAKSLWITRFPARYSIPLATCKHISNSFL